MAATVVALGDSVTVGVGDIGVPAGWAAHLSFALGAAEFTNVARLGARARDVSSIQAAVAIGRRPQLATLLVGGNDVLRGDFSAQDVASHVDQTVAGLRRVGADVAVVLLHDPRLTLPGPRLIREVLGERAAAVNDAIRARVAGEPRVALIDPQRSDFTPKRQAWSIDRLHPSAAGHRALAAMALEALTDLGWRAQHPISPPLGPQPSGWHRAWWLTRYGTPWFAKRSRDLLPELAWVCWEHRRRRRLTACASR